MAQFGAVGRLTMLFANIETSDKKKIAKVLGEKTIKTSLKIILQLRKDNFIESMLLGMDREHNTKEKVDCCTIDGYFNVSQYREFS